MAMTSDDGRQGVTAGQTERSAGPRFALGDCQDLVQITGVFERGVEV